MFKELKVAAFVAGYGQLYMDIVDRNLAHVPIDQLEETRRQIKSLGYRTRIRFRGPRIGTDGRHTLKKHARAFTVYLI
jgi:hypothetical protein